MQKLKDDNSNIQHSGNTNPSHIPGTGGITENTSQDEQTGTRPGNINDPANSNRPDNPSPGRSDENRLDL
ncbi:hypothetical protein ACNI3T_03455 [Christiangramia sp. ASW11-125]|uniref:hypothetical protein n=1 Tax=Christiangramia sp. ASW11-125 TaxID=3400701 RepID=UPI003AB0C040